MNIESNLLQMVHKVLLLVQTADRAAADIQGADLNAVPVDLVDDLPLAKHVVIGNLHMLERLGFAAVSALQLDVTVGRAVLVAVDLFGARNLNPLMEIASQDFLLVSDVLLLYSIEAGFLILSGC